MWATNKVKQTTLSLAKFTAAIAVCFVMVTSLATASQPYTKSYGADVFTGGWFDSSLGLGSCNSSLNYQKSPLPAAGAGGIFTYTKTTGGGAPRGGSSSQYGVFSSGPVNGAFNGINGFSSSDITNPWTNSTLLTFSNRGAGFGGAFDGASGNQGNCIPDYYNSKKLPSATAFNSATIPNWSTATGQYTVDTGAVPLDLLSGPLVIPAGNKLTIFVKGNVYIDANITYAAATESNVQKFALVVLGSIYVDPSVGQLDGLYIAQADPAFIPSPLTGDTGIFWSCHNNSTAPVLDNFPNTCTNKLTVNGAVIAKQLNLLRTTGDITPATRGEVSSSNNIAEVFNYTPQMLMGGPFFNPPAPNNLKIQSLISLPPVF